MPKTIFITLPSFLRRVMKAYVLKAHIRSVESQLCRIGRSRNWQLKVFRHNIPLIIEKLEADNEPSWAWLVKLLREQNESLSHNEMLTIAKKSNGITVNELVHKTDCTLAQARRVIDELEAL